MDEGCPSVIAINHDDYHAKYIGRTADDRQFFLTLLFEPRMPNNPGCEYVARFLFDLKGELLESEIESFGPRGAIDEARRREVFDNLLEDLGEVTFQRIEVAPFSVEKDGKAFGLIPREPEEEEDIWSVVLLPGDCMAFFEPWDSGDYDT